jgi:hypothetical protein
MALLILVLLSLIAATFDRYGFSQDEHNGFLRADSVLRFLSSSDKTAIPSKIDMFHGAAPDVLSLLAQRLAPSLSYDSRHLVLALIGVAGILTCIGSAAHLPELGSVSLLRCSLRSRPCGSVTCS